MTIHDQAIVLKTLKYGDSSAICHLFIRDWGLHRFMLKGVYSSKSKTKKSGLLHPGHLLDIIFDKHPQRSLQYLKEFQLSHTTPQDYESVIKNCIKTFCVEVLGHFVVDEGEEHQPLFDLYRHTLMAMYSIEDTYLANLPLYFLIRSAEIAGYVVNDNYHSIDSPLFHLTQGNFAKIADTYSTLTQEDSFLLAQMLRCNKIENALALKMTNTSRRAIMQQYISFLTFHTGTFQELKCLPVLHAILT